MSLSQYSNKIIVKSLKSQLYTIYGGKYKWGVGRGYITQRWK